MIKPGVLHTAHELMGHGATDAHGAIDHGAEAVAQAVSHAGEAASHAGTMVSGFTIPGLLEIGTFLGFAALFAFFFLNQLTKAPLVAKRDPYIDESLHHHVV
jgi:hypothetical protein